MKLIQKIAFCATLALMGSASASTLFWQINADAAGPLGWDGTGNPTYAVLKATTGTLAEGVGIAGYDLSEGKVWATDLGTYGNSSYSFFVELINASGSPVYTQKAATSYDNLLSSGYVSASALDRPTGALSGGFNGASVPEPTSGVLLLVGGALLALRRRRA